MYVDVKFYIELIFCLFKIIVLFDVVILLIIDFVIFVIVVELINMSYWFWSVRIGIKCGWWCVDLRI